MAENIYEVILCIVNAGFSDSVMVAARHCGARGGTVLNARGTAKEEAEKAFKISIQPEKEIVLILVKKELRDTILHAIYKEVGLNTMGQGIAFSIPVDEVVGMTDQISIPETEEVVGTAEQISNCETEEEDKTE